MGSENLSCECKKQQTIHLSSTKTGILVATSSVFDILAVIGNVLVLYLVYRKHSLRNTSNFFLCSLALADLLTGLVLLPTSVSTVLLGIFVDHNKTLTNFRDFLRVQLLGLTTMNICAVSIDRLIAVKRPLRYPSIMTPVTTRRIIQTMWFISIVFAIPVTCFSSRRFFLIYWPFVCVTTIFIPFLIIVYCYSIILKISSAQQQRIISVIRMHQSTNNQNGLSRNLRNRKAMKKFFAIMVVLISSSLPNLTCSILSVIPLGKCPSIVQDILNNWDWFVLFLLLTPFLNPCIYGLGNQQFKSAFRTVICKNNHHEPNIFEMAQQAT